MRRARRYAFAVSLAVSASTLADDWTTGVGGNPSRTSLSLEPGPTTPAILWQGSESAVVAQQAVIEGNVVVMPRMFDINDTLHGTDVVAHDLVTGAILWHVQLPVNFGDSWRSRVSAIRDGQVYATRSGNANAEYLYALSIADGSILWRSTALITESTTESCAFAPDGDPITTGVNSVVRIDRDTGLTVWETPRFCPTTGGCDAVVSNGRVYCFEPGVNGPVITAFDLDTGMRRYSSAGLGGGFFQQIAPFAGPDGTIYAPRSENNATEDYLFALEDTGSGFHERWRVPMGYVPFASHGIGPDGSVYAYGRNQEILRLDSATGNPLGMTSPIVSDFHQPRMAIDALGRIYLTNGGFSQGALLSFEADLSPRWSVPIANVNVGGPAIGGDGVLVVCGTGSDVRAFFTTPSLTLRHPSPGAAGTANAFVATHGSAGVRTYFAWSPQTGSTNVPGCPGLAVALSHPQLLGSVVADPSGDATISRLVPSSARGRTVRLQAAQRATCTASNVVTVTFR
jgi:outer membrane protein assembly factor BamB